MVEIRYRPSAFKHGIKEEDIRHAVMNRKYDKPINPECDKFLILGHDRSGNLLEIVYADIDYNTIRVFHAMKCRKSYEPFIITKGQNLWPI